MKQYHLHRSATFDRPLREVFPFFSEAGNLEAITPTFLHFRILTPRPLVMRKGLHIDYELKLHGIRFRWKSEITVWEPPHVFVDEQLKGPYRKWVHEHRFEERDGQTVVEDNIDYAVWGPSIIEKLFVAPQLKTIFDYRREQMEKFLGPTVTAAAS